MLNYHLNLFHPDSGSIPSVTLKIKQGTEPETILGPFTREQSSIVFSVNEGLLTTVTLEYLDNDKKAALGMQDLFIAGRFDPKASGFLKDAKFVGEGEVITGVIAMTEPSEDTVIEEEEMPAEMKAIRDQAVEEFARGETEPFPDAV